MEPRLEAGLFDGRGRMEGQPPESPMRHPASRPRLLLALGASAALLLGACQGPKPSEPPPPAAPALPPSTSSSPAPGSAAPKGAEAAALEERGRSSGLLQGHTATVACLRGERAQTDGNELRCEDWTYVRQNYAGTR